MLKRQDQNRRDSQRPIKTVQFEEGDKIFVDLPKQGIIEAEVATDMGDTCLIDKGKGAMERYRFGIVHKSRISRRLDERPMLLK